MGPCEITKQQYLNTQRTSDELRARVEANPVLGEHIKIGNAHYDLDPNPELTKQLSDLGQLYFRAELWVRFTLKGVVRENPTPVDSLRTIERTVVYSVARSECHTSVEDAVRWWMDNIDMDRIIRNVVQPEIDDYDFQLGGDAIEVQHLRVRIGDILQFCDAVKPPCMAMALPCEPLDSDTAEWHWLMAKPDETKRTIEGFLSTPGDGIYEMLMTRGMEGQ